jgi:hypothetical protein
MRCLDAVRRCIDSGFPGEVFARTLEDGMPTPGAIGFRRSRRSRRVVRSITKDRFSDHDLSSRPSVRDECFDHRAGVATRMLRSLNAPGSPSAPLTTIARPGDERLRNRAPLATGREARCRGRASPSRRARRYRLRSTAQIGGAHRHRFAGRPRGRRPVAVGAAMWTVLVVEGMC